MSFNRKYLVLVVLLAAGCGGGGYSGRNINSPTGSPPGATSTAFTPFIKAQLTQTSDTSEPIDVNDLQFEFDDDETSFDDVLQ